jgi:hypothetical protein
MRIFLLSIIAILSGCSTVVPVTAKFPDVPIILTQPCPDLVKLEGEKIVITDMLKTVVHNYSLYWECAVKVDSWNKWYTDQKIIFNLPK